ncbi:recombinase family protein [uncultured Flavonifractor sp.]|uniref:recombinase family protein n=1 Tax=uncultured Flavonifractor sp. TaxID=1193534 RepID=UPI0025D86B9E|nr:recombinase family protein [uncultured Flavonifractor sp.]
MASYCRVSTDKDDQANSFESQQRYFRAYIDRQPEWELYQIYADEGITGTSTKKRAAFNQMIADARMGKFERILTKEVSRFSRNILDTIAYTRELKALGVGVLFLNDGISTLEPDAELRLSIMGSIAQEESRKTSSRVKWGQTRRMEQGVVFGRSLLGYDVKDGRLTVNPEGAELVRLIFHKYGVEKKGTTVIARELREAGYRTHRGGIRWNGSCIVKLLKNEKYVGDLIQKKTITPDYLTHAKKANHGEEELVIIRDHHPPIIDQELWDVVQEELKKRNRNGALGAGHSNRYIFSGKIKCGECGASFVSRQRKRKDGSLSRRWSCYSAVNEGGIHVDPQGNRVGCDVRMALRDEVAMDMLRQALRTLRLDSGGLIDSVTAIALEAIRAGEQSGGERRESLELRLEQLNRKREAALDAFFSRDITREEMRRMTGRYDREAAELRERLARTGARSESSCEKAALRDDIRRRVAGLVNGEGDSEIFCKTILDHMVVYRDQRVEVRLNLLPQTWCFVLERLKQTAQNDPDVPISVSRPLSSG